MNTHPFRALRPPTHLAADVASPPYDVVNTETARALAAGRPESFLHIVRPEIDLPPGTDLYDDAVYAKAAENFRDFQDRGWLVRDSEPAFFVYRQAMGEQIQTGVVTTCHVRDYEEDRILRHESTRAKTEDDRTRHVDALGANAGPVFLTFRDEPVLNELIENATSGAPEYDFTADDDVRHTVWKVTETAPWVDAFAAIPRAYVADGHHRSAAAARVGRMRREQNPDHTGHEAYNWFLAVLFPASRLNILPYNRCVADLNGLSPETFLEAVGHVMRVEAGGADCPDRARSACMYLDGTWHTLSWPPPAGDDPAAALDVSVLQERILGPILGIDDPRQSPRIDFVGGIHGPGELVRRVEDGRAAVAFSLYPTDIRELMDVADARRNMPPKSTWFEPKLRSGLLVHTLDGDI